MIGSVEKAVTDIQAGRRYPVYLLHGDEFLAKQGARAIIEALVPPSQQSLCVETVMEDRELASLPMRVATVPLFGGNKVVVVYDSKAFVSKQNAGNLAKRSLEAWQDGDAERAARLFLQAVAAIGEGEIFLDRAGRGEMPDQVWRQILEIDRNPEAERWLQEVAGRVLTDKMEIPEAAGADVARVYEETIERGISSTASLILTAEVIDQRRALFKKINEIGFVIDCGVRTGKTGETQMRPEAARAKIQEMVKAAGKSTPPDEAMSAIVNRTGFSVRALTSELEKILLYVGTRPAITLADVEAVLSNSREANVFDLTNAVSERDGGKALRALRNLSAQREPAPRTLGMLAVEIRNLIVARSALDRRLNGTLDPNLDFRAFQSRVLPRLNGEVQGDDGSAAKLCAMHPYRTFNLLKSASRFSLQGLLRGLAAIHETDLALKTSGQPEELLMEQLVIRLCAGS